MQGFKFGLFVLTSIKNAKQVDLHNGNTLWMDDLRKEMAAVMVTFEVQLEEMTFVRGYEQISGHIVWDVKMDFTWMERYVAGRHRTNPPKALTYSSVFSRESVQIALMVAGLNRLDIRLVDIGNAYLAAPTTEKYYVVAGGECRPYLKGRVLKIVRALSAGAAFCTHLAFILHLPLQFMLCQADLDVWMHQASQADGTSFYEYILVYVEDVMVLSGDPDVVIQDLKDHFTKIVTNPAKQPEQYLGAMIGKYQFPDGW
jgi:hypothetical protein